MSEMKGFNNYCQQTQTMQVQQSMHTSLTKPFVPIGSLSLGNFAISFWQMVTYWSDTGYKVCIAISVRNTCMISRLALEHTTPVSIAR